MQISENKLGPTDCACKNLRMTTRVVTGYYDNALQSSGLKVTQFSLMNSISLKEDGISVNELAEVSLMDQSTVTRNIEILRKAGYVEVKTEDSDSRRKRITVSEAGKIRLAAATPLWKEAQLRVQQTIGPEQYKSLLEGLELLRQLK